MLFFCIAQEILKLVAKNIDILISLMPEELDDAIIEHATTANQKQMAEAMSKRAVLPVEEQDICKYTVKEVGTLQWNVCFSTKSGSHLNCLLLAISVETKPVSAL